MILFVVSNFNSMYVLCYCSIDSKIKFIVMTIIIITPHFLSYAVTFRLIIIYFFLVFARRG